MLSNFCHVLSRFYLRERIYKPNLCYPNCFEGLISGPLNKNFLINNFSVYCCVFFHWLTLAQNTILRQRMQVEFNASHIYNTRITSVNVGEFYRIFTFRFSFWALFDAQLMNCIWKYGFSNYYNTEDQFCFYFENSRAANSDGSQSVERWDWRSSINLHRTMNNILMTFQSRSTKVDPTNIHKGG